MSGRPRTLTEVPDSLAPLLAKARRRPVTLSRNGKAVAVLISTREYEELQRAAQAHISDHEDPLSPEEERMLAKIADDIVEEDDFISVEASRKLHEDVRRAAKAARAKSKQSPQRANHAKFTEEMAEAEDRYWTKVADKAMKEGMLSVKESEEFLTNMRKRLDLIH